MKKVLYIFGELKDQDIDWISGVGSKEFKTAGTVLIHEGVPIETLYIILQGKFEVLLANKTKIAEMGVGDVAGELSFLDSRPPVASVAAITNSYVLAIAVSRLKSKLLSDLGFASRFYRALGILLADRLRERSIDPNQKSTNLEEDIEEFGEISAEIMGTMGLAATRFDNMLRKVMSS